MTKVKRMHQPKPYITGDEMQRRVNYADVVRTGPTPAPRPRAAPATPAPRTPNGGRPKSHEGLPHRQMFRADRATRAEAALTKKEAAARVDASRWAPAAGLTGAGAEAGDALARRLGARPLKPPPGRIADTTATAAALALAKDKRLGIVEDWS
jgi:hypothetical protein